MNLLLTFVLFTFVTVAFPAQSMKRLRDDISAQSMKRLRDTVQENSPAQLPIEIVYYIVICSCNKVDIHAPWNAIKRLGKLKQINKYLRMDLDTLLSDVQRLADLFNIPPPFILALQGKKSDLIKLSIDHKNQARNHIYIIDRYRKTILDYEKAGGHILFLRNFGFNVNIPILAPDKSIAPEDFASSMKLSTLEESLYSADENSFENALDKLIEKKGNINFSIPPLLEYGIFIHNLAVHNNHQKIAIILEKQKKIIEESTLDIVGARDEQGLNALHHSALRCSNDCFKELCEFEGFPVNAQDIKGRTVLHILAKQGKLFFIKMILKRKDLKLNIQDYDGNTPLHLALEFKHFDCFMELLKEKGILLSLQNNSGYTVFHWAAVNDDCARLKALLYVNSEAIDAQIFPGTRNGSHNWSLYTPLHIAAKLGNYDICNELLRFGANRTLKNHEDKIARDLAKENGHEEIVELIDSFFCW